MNRAIRRALAYANRKQGQPQTPQAAAPVPVRPVQQPITRQKDLPPDPTRSQHTQERKRFQDGGSSILLQKDEPERVSLPLRPYEQRFNPKSGKLDAAERKDIGFYGPIKNPMTGHEITEYSSDRDFQYPTVYEGMSDKDRAAIMLAERLGKNAPKGALADVDDRAYAQAKKRKAQGRSPFYEPGKDPYPKWSPEQHWDEPYGMPKDESLYYAHGGTVDGHNPMSKDNLNKALDVALSATHPKRLHHTLARTGYAEGGIPDIQGPAELAGETPYTHGKTLASQFDVAKVQPYKAAKIAPGPVDVKLPKKSMVRAPRADIGKMRMHKPKMKKFKGLQFAKGGAAIEDALNLASRTMADMAKGIGREDGLHGASMQQGATSTIVKEKLPGKKSEVVYEHHAKTPVEREEFASGGRAELAVGGDPTIGQNPATATPTTATAQPTVQSQLSDVFQRNFGNTNQNYVNYIADQIQQGKYTLPQAQDWLQSQAGKDWYSSAAGAPATTATAPTATAAPATTAPQPQVSDLLTKYYGSSNQGIADYINKQIQSGTYTMPQVDAWLQTPEAKSWYASATAAPAATSAQQQSGAAPSLQTAAQATTPTTISGKDIPYMSYVVINGKPVKVLDDASYNNVAKQSGTQFGQDMSTLIPRSKLADYQFTKNEQGQYVPSTGTSPTTGGTGTGPQQRQVIDRQAYDQAYNQWQSGYNTWKQQVDVVNMQLATKQIGDWPSYVPKTYPPAPNPAAYMKTVEETAPSQEQMNAFANTIVGRNVTNDEVKQWQDFIKAGGTNQQIINAMSTSDMAKNYTLQQIHDLYAQSTGLSPTTEQLKTIADDIGAKKYTFSQLQSSLNSSPEADRYRQTLVANTFKDAIGQDLPPEQAAAISKDVQAGKYSLGQLRDAWANSTQGQSNDIQQLYKNVTGQDLSPAQLNDLNSALTNKTYTADQIRDSISNMPQAIDTTRQQFAQDTLGRKLAPEELQKWSDYVAQGQTPEDQQNLSYEYQQSLLNTPEAKSNENAQLVKDTFDAYGITNPTPEQINSFADALNKGAMTPEQMDASVGKLPNAGTGEYIAPYDVAGKAVGKQGVPITPVRYTNWAKDVINNSFDVLQQGLKPFMDVLAGKEAGTAGYDAFNNPGNKISGGAGKTVEGALGKPLRDMTVGEVEQRQSGSSKSRDFFAVGKYQIIPSTLKALVKRMGIDPNEKFTDQLQEKLGAGLALLQRPALGKFLLGLPGGSLKQAGIETAREWRSMPDPRTGKTYQDKGSRGNKALITTRELNDTLLKTRANLQGAISFAPEGAGIIPKKGTPQPDTTSAPPPKTDEQLISEFLSSQGIPLGNQYQQQLDLLRQLGISGAGGNVGQGAFGLGGGGASGQPYDGSAAVSQSIKDMQAAFEKQFSPGTPDPNPTANYGRAFQFGGSQRFDLGMEQRGWTQDAATGAWSPPPWAGDTAGSGSNTLSYLGGNRGGRMTGENREEYAEGGTCGDSEYGFSVDCGSPIISKRQTPPSWQIGKPTPGSVKSASTPGSKKGSVATPEFYFPPEEYKKGNLGKGKFSMKSGGRTTGNEEALRIADHYANGGGAWTRKEGKNPKGGLNAKGRASLRAQGHDIRPPAPHPKTDKDAARRKSFCARMSGMPGPMKDDNGKPTRKALSLRAWNCRADGGMIDDALRLARSKVKE